jgi:hypothetical protein
LRPLRLLTICLAALGSATSAATPTPKLIEVMVVGVYHMANPGQDTHNIHVDDVTAPSKQAQIAAAVAALARFRPTTVALETDDADANGLDRGFARFTPAMLTTNRNERVQLGYRLARVAGITRVLAVDAQPGPGEPDFFPFEAVQEWAKAHGRADELVRQSNAIQSAAERFGGEQKTRSVADLLGSINAPDSPLGEGQQRNFYLPLLTFGAGTDQPGAVLNGRWYTRNALIVAKLVQAARPGDRIVLMFGSGHLYWLRQIIAGLPGYRLVDPVPYLAGKTRR